MTSQMEFLHHFVTSQYYVVTVKSEFNIFHVTGSE
jgi:hypothetical protein